MTEGPYGTGDLINLLAAGWEGTTGVVSRPIHEDNEGHALVLQGGVILGIDVSEDDVEPVG